MEKLSLMHQSRAIEVTKAIYFYLLMNLENYRRVSSSLASHSN